MEIFIIILSVAVILIGLAGTVIPALPGNPLIFLGALVWAMYFGFGSVGVGTLVILGSIAVLAQVFDYLASAYGAKKFGSTKWGIWGSIFGGIFGMIVLNVIGLVFGVFLGAVLAELVFAGKSAQHSLKVGLGSILGFLGGTVLKFILGIVMIAIFVMAVL